MKIKVSILFISLLSFSAYSSQDCPEILQYEFKKLHSAEQVKLCDASSAKAVLMVNTASHCGFTGQFSELEELHQRYTDRGLVIVGFPSNDFRQEASDESKTAEVCYINYGVTFTMVSPQSVRGDSAHPLFKILAEKSAEPRWNFNKYLVNPFDQSVVHYGSSTKPTADSLVDEIEALL